MARAITSRNELNLRKVSTYKGHRQNILTCLMVSHLTILFLFSVFIPKPIFAQETQKQGVMQPDVGKKPEFDYFRPFEDSSFRSPAAPKLSIISSALKMVEQSPIYLKFRWTATVQNKAKAGVSVNIHIRFIDSDGSTVYETPKRLFVVSGNNQTELTGDELIETTSASGVKSARLEIEPSP